MQVGFIGLGKMGRPMTQRLLAAGHTVHVFNRSRGAVDALAADGARPAAAAGPGARRARTAGPPPPSGGARVGGGGGGPSFLPRWCRRQSANGAFGGGGRGVMDE